MGFKINGMEIENIFKDMTDDELCKIKDTASQIMENRDHQKKEKAWLAVKNAIADYCKEYGSIDFYDYGNYERFTICFTDDFSTIGTIREKI